MKNYKILLMILGLLIAPNIFAATAQVNNVIRFGFNYVSGGQGVDNPSGVIPVGNLSKIVTLTAETSSSTSNHYYMLMKMNSPGSVSQYQVPIGKTFYAMGFYLTTSTAGICILFGYGTAALVADDTATPPTGSVRYTASSQTCGIRSDAASATRFIPIPVSFPASSYPYIEIGNASASYNVEVVGMEL